MMKKRGLAVIWLPLALLFLAACRGSVEVESGTVTIKDLKLPAGCHEVQFQVKIEQEGETKDEPRVETPVITAVTDEAETARVGYSGINLAESIKVTITVQAVQGICGDFKIGAQWIYDGKATKEGEEKYSLELSQFRKVPSTH